MKSTAIKLRRLFNRNCEFILSCLTREQLDGSFPADATMIVRMEEHVADDLLYNRRINFKYKRVFTISKRIVYRIFKFLFIVEEYAFVIEGC